MKRISPRRSEPDTPQEQPSPDQAWKILSLVNEWIRHADSKVGVTLAFTGVMATMTYNLASATGLSAPATIITFVIAGLLLVATGIFCACTLLPRIDDGDIPREERSRLYFSSIAARYSRTQYQHEIYKLANDPVALTREIADQIHANSKIADTKSKFARRAITAALLSGVSVVIFAIVAEIGNR